MHDMRLIFGFALHTMVATALFALVGAAAALLHYYTGALARLEMPGFILQAIRGTEYFLFIIDIVCFIVYVSRETWLLLRSMLSQNGAQHDTTITDSPI